MVHNFKKINAWNEAIDLAVKIYELTKKFPDEEKFGLVAQLRRSSISISSNIAEGAGRETSAQFINFLRIAQASANELRSQLILSNRLFFVSNEELKDLENKVDKIQRMISNFKKQLTNKENRTV